LAYSLDPLDPLDPLEALGECNALAATRCARPIDPPDTVGVLLLPFGRGRLMAKDTEAGLTTSAVAERLGVSASTVRRYIKDGYLPEPGWGRVGRRRQRIYSEGWVRAAEEKLASDQPPADVDQGQNVG
jgi:excisionase family DNA binding protein